MAGLGVAAAPYTATPTRLERLLRALDEIADLLDIAVFQKLNLPEGNQRVLVILEWQKAQGRGGTRR